MPFDQKINDEVCQKFGHKITNFPQHLQDPASKQQVTMSSEFFCTACGRSLDNIRERPKVKRTRKAKDAAMVAPE